MNIDEKFELINVTVEISWSFVEPREGAATRAVAHDDRTGRAVVPIDGAGVIRSAIVREGVGRRRRG